MFFRRSTALGLMLTGRVTRKKPAISPMNEISIARAIQPDQTYLRLRSMIGVSCRKTSAAISLASMLEARLPAFLGYLWGARGESVSRGGIEGARAGRTGPNCAI